MQRDLSIKGKIVFVLVQNRSNFKRQVKCILEVKREITWNEKRFLTSKERKTGRRIRLIFFRRRLVMYVCLSFVVVDRFVEPAESCRLRRNRGERRRNFSRQDTYYYWKTLPFNARIRRTFRAFYTLLIRLCRVRVWLKTTDFRLQLLSHYTFQAQE